MNGRVGIVVAPRGRLTRAIAFEVRGGKIVEIDVILEPSRLRRLEVAVLTD